MNYKVKLKLKDEIWNPVCLPYDSYLFDLSKVKFSPRLFPSLFHRIFMTGMTACSAQNFMTLTVIRLNSNFGCCKNVELFQIFYYFLLSVDITKKYGHQGAEKEEIASSLP